MTKQEKDHISKFVEYNGSDHYRKFFTLLFQMVETKNPEVSLKANIRCSNKMKRKTTKLEKNFANDMSDEW